MNKINKWGQLFIGAGIYLFLSSIIVYLIEPETFETPFNALWYVMTTVTTVGYGDVSPSTVAGKTFVMVTLFIFGIGFIGTLIGAVVELFTLKRRKIEGGDIVYKGKDHIIIIGWSQKSKIAMEELLAVDDMTNIVIIDTLDKAPFLSDRVSYVKGEASKKETYERANFQEAKAAFVFSDDSILDTMLADGKTLIIASTIENYAPHVHTTVVIKDENHKEMFKNKVDSVVSANETIARLVVQTTLIQGITEVHQQLFSHKEGENIYSISKKESWKTYRDAFNSLLENGATLISNGQDCEINKKLNETIPENATLNIICNKETYLKLKSTQ